LVQKKNNGISFGFKNLEKYCGERQDKFIKMVVAISSSLWQDRKDPLQEIR
jgi:hypothetical protein